MTRIEDDLDVQGTVRQGDGKMVGNYPDPPLPASDWDVCFSNGTLYRYDNGWGAVLFGGAVEITEIDTYDGLLNALNTMNVGDQISVRIMRKSTTGNPYWWLIFSGAKAYAYDTSDTLKYIYGGGRAHPLDGANCWTMNASNIVVYGYSYNSSTTSGTLSKNDVASVEATLIRYKR